MSYLYQNITDKIIKCFYEVYNTLGYRFLEKVYEVSLFEELKINGLYSERQKKIEVYYKEKLVSEYYADIFVENKIILELKAAESICEEHEYQLINYLKATKIELGLLLNFGKNQKLKEKYLLIS